MSRHSFKFSIQFNMNDQLKLYACLVILEIVLDWTVTGLKILIFRGHFKLSQIRLIVFNIPLS